jgi:hypothetical protein
MNCKNLGQYTLVFSKFSMDFWERAERSSRILKIRMKKKEKRLK